MTQLTIRGFEPQLEQRLRDVAQHQGLSLNKAALLLMRRGAGLESPASQANVVGSALDEFIGVWSKKEEQDFLRTLEPFEEVDPDFWK